MSRLGGEGAARARVDDGKSGHRADRSRGDGAEPRAQHERPRLPGRGLQPQRLPGGRVPRGSGERDRDHRHPPPRGAGGGARAPARGDAHGEGGCRRRPLHREPAPAPRRGGRDRGRRELPLRRQRPARGGARAGRHRVRGGRHLRRRGGRAPRALDHAGRQSRRLAPRPGPLPGHQREGGRRALLPLGGRGGRRPLREDGAQRHRVRGHAAHLRGLAAHARGPGAGRRRARRDLRRVAARRARFVPHRDHERHPRPEGRRRLSARRQDPRRRRPEGHRQVGGHRRAGARDPRSPSSAKRCSRATSPR